jgi:cell division protease FtsH
MGGRAAEELVLGEVSTGSENDLAQATHIARQIICQFGMGESVGLMHVVQDGGLAGDPAAGWLQRDCSEDMARAIDEEVKQILEQAHADACDILADHRDQLYRVAERLLERESIEEAEFRALLISDDEEPS